MIRKRYDILPKLVKQFKVRTLMEIGMGSTMNNAKAMLCAMLENYKPEEITYYGFDLFEQLEPEQQQKERSEACISYQEAADILDGFKIRYRLLVGNTKVMLPQFVNNLFSYGYPPDFIWLDGGHSYETVKSDWFWTSKLLKPNTHLCFDDYFFTGPDKWGVTRVVNEIDRERYNVKLILPLEKDYHGWMACLALVELK